jgi:uncharacterized damage-inducible protein DinB
VNRTLLGDAFGHHAWATIVLIDACLPLSEEQLATTVPGTYGSILDTMRHTVGADAGYLFTLTAGRVPQIDEAGMDLAELRPVMERHEREWQSLIEQELDPDATVVRHRDDGTDSYAPLGVRIAQVLHHGTDHRSQVCTALTTIGVTPPDIDVWAFAEKDGRVREVQRAS